MLEKYLTPPQKKLIKFALKLLLTIGAVYLVTQKIEMDKAWEVLKGASPWALFVAFLFFNFSKISSAFRLHLFLKAIDIGVTALLNLKLYYLGMFYNLFLPGGIGGDGYKIFLLGKWYTIPRTKIFQALLLDRLNGMMALGIYALLLITFLGYDMGYPLWAGLSLFIAIIAYPIFVVGSRLIFKATANPNHKAFQWSLLVQLFQLLCAYFILQALGVDEYIPEYLTLFLISSIVAIIPFTVGGVGARELVFIYAAAYTGISEEKAVVFSMLFFMITALSSFTGVGMKVEEGA
ncbi:lysylphosphatidylglycerol synthase transmembrane domain-containing protein [Algivirga pacifica]|uniref:Lysylphosphatidylglycerol synthase transmembrane domain-containing protein n=1 Tax=Algivirga pacifica TaxID=1162670 RepID=A0ABP9D0G0_9BACT